MNRPKEVAEINHENETDCLQMVIKAYANDSDYTGSPSVINPCAPFGDFDEMSVLDRNARCATEMTG